MLLRVVILASISLAIGVASAAAILKLSKHKGAQSVDNLVITTKGLDDFGVTLELPYEGRSPYHVLLLNNSQYQIIACQIVFEFVTDKGEVRPAHKVVAYSEPLKE